MLTQKPIPHFTNVIKSRLKAAYLKSLNFLRPIFDLIYFV